MAVRPGHRVVLLTTSLYLGAVPCFAGNKVEFTKSLVEASSKMTFTMVKTVIKSSPDAAVADPNLPAERAALRNVMRGYQEERARRERSLGLKKPAAEFGVAAVSAGVAFGASPVGGIIIKAAAQAATDAYFEDAEQKLKQDLRVVLASKRDQLQTVGGVKYDQLKDLPVKEIKEKLAASPELYSDLRSMFPVDEDGKALADSLIVDAVRNTTLVALDKIELNAKAIDEAKGRIETVNKSLEKFKDQTTTAFKAHEDAIGALQGAMGDLGKSVKGLDDRLKAQEQQGALIAEFMFDNSSPAEKAALLEAGYKEDQFRCGDGGSDCEVAKTKDALIEQFKAEAKVQEALGDMRVTLAAVSNVASIANNLGLKIDGLDQAVSIGNAAVSAFAAYASGDYLGAISAVSGVFGGRTDPAAERHAQLMAYLGQEFAKINKKLEEIVGLQKQTLQMIADLSKQLEAYYQALDEKLDRMNFELKSVLLSQKREEWRPWLQCHSAYQELTDAPAMFDFVNGQFTSLTGIDRFISASGQELKNCLNVAKTTAASITATNWFGNFFSLAAAINITVDADLTGSAAEKYHEKKSLELYQKNVYDPVRNWVEEEAANSRTPLPLVYQGLVAPSATTVELRRRTAAEVALLNALRKNLPENQQPAACNSNGEKGFLTDSDTRRLLCSTGEGAERNAQLLLESPMVTDHIMLISDWLLTLAPVFDLFSNDSFVKAQQVLGSENVDLQRQGRSALDKISLVLDASIASYAMTYGDIGADVVAAKLGRMRNGKEGDLKDDRAAIRQLLTRNPYLSRNVLMIALRSPRPDAALPRGAFNPAVDSMQGYDMALDYASKPNERRFMELEALFGDGWSFSFDEKRGVVTAELLPAEGTDPAIISDMPLASEFLDGQFHYPERLHRMLSYRNALAERLLDYDLLGTLTTEDRVALIGMMTRTEAKSVKE